MQLPIFAVELAGNRLPPTAFTAATMGAEIYDPGGRPGGRVTLDRVVPAGLPRHCDRRGRPPGQAAYRACCGDQVRARTTTADFACSTLRGPHQHRGAPA